MPDAFTGFPVAALDFYDDLEADNTRSFWTAHRAVYDACVRAPMVALCAELEPEFGAATVFRPHRDVRFAKDKSPFKTHQGAYVETRGAGCYVQLSASGLQIGSGMYVMAPDQLARFRTAVDDDRRGEALLDAVAEASAAGHALHGDVMKTRPRGVPEDHPRLELLRHRSLSTWLDVGAPDWLHTAAVRDRVAQAWREAASLRGWLAEHVGPSDRPRR